MKPDYQSYTLEELFDVQSHIDKEAYPDRYKELLKELESRDKSEPKGTVKENINKPKRKRTNKEKIISSSFILVAAVACIYYGIIPGKYGGLTMEEDPYFFWGTLLFVAGLAVNQLLTLESNQKESDNDA